jgi:hypothetical protein
MNDTTRSPLEEPPATPPAALEDPLAVRLYRLEADIAAVLVTAGKIENALRLVLDVISNLAVQYKPLRRAIEAATTYPPEPEQ